MADLDVLLSLLGQGSGSNVSDIGAFQNQIAQSDFYKQAAAPILGAKFNTSTWTPGQSFGVSAGQAFLGSLLGAIGDQYESRQLEKVASVLPDLYKDPLNVVTPEGVDAKAFANLKLNAATRKDAASSSSLQKLVQDLLGTKVAGLTEKEKELGKNAAYEQLSGGSAGLLNPLSKEKNSIEEKARDALKSVPLVTNFQDLKTNFKTMTDVYGLDNKPATLAFVSSFARVLDPNSVVREGEIKNAENTQSFLSSLGYNLKSLVDGSQNIGPEAKQQMLQAASAKYNTFGTDFNKYLTAQRELVKGLGGRPENVFAPTEYEPFDFNSWATQKGIGVNISRDAAIAELRRRGLIQ